MTNLERLQRLTRVFSEFDDAGDFDACAPIAEQIEETLRNLGREVALRDGCSSVREFFATASPAQCNP